MSQQAIKNHQDGVDSFKRNDANTISFLCPRCAYQLTVNAPLHDEMESGFVKCPQCKLSTYSQRQIIESRELSINLFVRLPLEVVS